jgi:uroporphyrinogen III methyltransferase/synthase
MLEGAKKMKIRPPAIVVVGDVVALRHQIGRQSKGKLSGQRVILTVSSALAKGWREVFEEEGAEVWEIPMTQIREIPKSKSWERDLKQTDWIALTSGAGVRAMIQVVADIRKLAAKKIAVVGPSTAEICRKNGLGVDFVGRGPGAMSLAKHWPGQKDEAVLHCTGSAEEGVLLDALQKRGFSVKRILMYRNIAPPRPPKVILQKLQTDGAEWVVFASGTAAERFHRLMGKSWATGIKTAVIGESTAKTARKAGWKVVAMAKDVSARAVLSAMLKTG